MLKRWMRKWLGIDELENTVLQQHGDQLALDSAYDNLKNLYDSNRMRIDVVRSELKQLEKTIYRSALIHADERASAAKITVAVKKKPTPKKGK